MLPFQSAFHLKEELQQINSEHWFRSFSLSNRGTEWPLLAAACTCNPPVAPPKPVKPASATVVDLDCGSTLSPPVTLSVLCLTQKHLSKQALIYDSSERCNLRFSGTRRGGGETKNKKKKKKKWASKGCQTSCDHFFAFPADMKEATRR